MGGDNLKKKHIDGKFISLSQSWEIEYWTKKLGVSKDTIQNAIDQTSHSAKDVREYLSIDEEE